MMQEQMPIVTSGLCRELPQACIPPQAKSRIPIWDDENVCRFAVGSRTSTISIKCILQVSAMTVPAGWR